MTRNDLNGLYWFWSKTQLRNKIKEFTKKWGCLPLSYFAHQKRIKNKTEKIILSYTIFDKYI
jgi:hypothetical protein